MITKLTMKEVIANYEAETGETQKDIKSAIKLVSDLVLKTVNCMEEDEAFTIPQLGTFKVYERKAKTCKNPKTGESIDVPAKRAVSFKPAKALKDSVEGN